MQKKDILQKIEELEKLEERRALSQEEMDVLETRRKEIREIYKGEDIYWRQRTRCRWLIEGDATTAFFYKVTNGRRHANTIHSLKNGEELLQGESVHREQVYHHYKRLFGLSEGVRIKMKVGAWNQQIAIDGLEAGLDE